MCSKCIVSILVKQWFLTQNGVLKWYENLQSRLLLVMNQQNAPFCEFIFSIKFCEIFQGLITKFQALPGVSGDFQGFKNFPGFSRISRACINPNIRPNNINSWFLIRNLLNSRWDMQGFFFEESNSKNVAEQIPLQTYTFSKHKSTQIAVYHLPWIWLARDKIYLAWWECWYNWKL